MKLYEYFVSTVITMISLIMVSQLKMASSEGHTGHSFLHSCNITILNL